MSIASWFVRASAAAALLGGLSGIMASPANAACPKGYYLTIGGDCVAYGGNGDLNWANWGYPNWGRPFRGSWGGWYVGVWTGWGFASSSWSDPENGFLGTANMNGLILGGYTGYNWVHGNYVVGIEGGAAWSDVHAGFNAEGWSFGGYIKGLEELRARLGVTTGPNSSSLWYGTVGVAAAQYKAISDWPEIDAHFEANKTFGGFTVGAGYEYRFTPNLSWRLEYSYYNFGSRGLNLTSNTDFEQIYHVDLSHLQMSTVTFGVNVAVSDVRLKRDITLVGHLKDGLGIYRYRYLWSDTVYVGVLAQEVALDHPDAVVRGPFGYLMVDYGKLGLKLMTEREWDAVRAQRRLALCCSQ